MDRLRLARSSLAVDTGRLPTIPVLRQSGQATKAYQRAHAGQADLEAVVVVLDGKEAVVVAVDVPTNFIKQSAQHTPKCTVPNCTF